MSIDSINSNSNIHHPPVISPPDPSQARKAALDGAESNKIETPAPSVNMNGQVIGQVINTSA